MKHLLFVLITALLPALGTAYDVDTVSVERTKEIKSTDATGKVKRTFYKDIEREEALIHSDEDLRRKKNKSLDEDDDDSDEEDE